MRCHLSFRTCLSRIVRTILLSLAGWTAVNGQTVTSQSQPLNSSGMSAELERLAQVCDTLGLVEQAARSRDWLPPQRTDQTLLFLPSPESKPTLNSSESAAQWLKSFMAARERHAEYWFDQAKDLATSGDEPAAYSLLWRVLRENSRHPESKRLLGPLVSGINAIARPRKSTLAHPQFAWPAGSFSRIELPHFLLTSRADNRQTEAFAKQLESFYILWTQVFYPLWAAPGVLTDRLEGSTTSWEPRRQVRVVLLRDRQEYIKTLGATEENIGVSVGYYNPEASTSFFYPDTHMQATLYHELTHQLLAEATRIGAVVDAGRQADFWMIEGTAMYMESLWQGNYFWTLGGWESPRLQASRYRALRDGYWVPWDTLRAGGMDDWKKDSDIAKLYTQAAGLTHFMLDATKGPAAEHSLIKNEMREAFFRALVAVYQGQSGADELTNLLGDEHLHARYKDFLTVTSPDVLALPPQRQLTDLVLTASNLSLQAWKSLESQKSLRWVDVAFSNIRNKDLEWVFNNRGLQRFSLEGTAVNSLARFSDLGSLEELDLSECAFDDVSIGSLANHRKLKTLWLTKTGVTDSVLKTLDEMSNLEFVDIQLTQVSSLAWQQFLKTHPRLKQGN